MLPVNSCDVVKNETDLLILSNLSVESSYKPGNVFFILYVYLQILNLKSSF